MKKKSELTGVGDILAGLKKTSDLGKHLAQAELWARWPEIAGPSLAPHGRPHSIKKQVLRVEVDSHVWLHKFTYWKARLIRRVNGFAQGPLIKDVFFVLIDDGETIEPS